MPDANGRAYDRSTMPADRLPPHDLAAELWCLGAMLQGPRWVDVVQVMLGPDDFYRDVHGRACRIIFGLRDRGEPADAVSVCDALERGGMGPTDALDLVTDFTQTCLYPDDVAVHAAIIREHARRREIIAALNQGLAAAYGREGSAAEVAASVEARLLDLTGDGSGRPTPLPDALIEAREEILRRIEGVLGGVPTGLADLDHRIGGSLGNGHLAILAARPSMGKSAMALNIAANAAAAGIPSLVFSLEMSCREMAERMLAGASRLGGRLLKEAWRMADAHHRQLDVAYEVIKGYPVYLMDRPVITMAQVAAESRRARAAHGVGLVVVDYLQLIDGTGESGEGRPSRHEVVSKISRRLKGLARELDVPVLALSQLNRECEGRADRRPMLSDLRESGAIEQDADVVVLLHRPEYYDPTDEPGVAEAIVAKNRNGETGTVRLAFLRDQTRFAGLA
jgi:replicative DNA helicase